MVWPCGMLVDGDLLLLWKTEAMTTTAKGKKKIRKHVDSKEVPVHRSRHFLQQNTPGPKTMMPAFIHLQKLIPLILTLIMNHSMAAPSRKKGGTRTHGLNGLPGFDFRSFFNIPFVGSQNTSFSFFLFFPFFPSADNWCCNLSLRTSLRN